MPKTGPSGDTIVDAATIAWGSVPDWIVAVTALFGVVFGLVQLRRIALANSNQVDIARAELMLEIDGRYEHEDMRVSRTAIRTLRNHCEQKALLVRPGASHQEMATNSAKFFSEEMTELYYRFKTADKKEVNLSLAEQPDDSAGARYFTLMRLPYWMETVGHLVQVGLLHEQDVLHLYDAVFTGVLTCFEQHIIDRRSDPIQRNDRFLENALWLKQRAENTEADRAKASKLSRAPPKSRIFQTPSLFRIAKSSDRRVR